MSSLRGTYTNICTMDKRKGFQLLTYTHPANPLISPMSINTAAVLITKTCDRNLTKRLANCQVLFFYHFFNTYEPIFATDKVHISYYVYIPKFY